MKNNMSEEIAGGVSPLKLRASKAKSRRGGEEAGAATAKTTSSGMVRKKYLGGRGGYKKSSGTEGTGVNRGGYNVHTRFKPRARPEGPKGGVEPTPRKKPYSFDKDGEIVINTGSEYKQDADVVTTKMVRTDKHGKVVKPEDDACSDVYIAKHGDAKCIEYKKHRKENPVDRSERKQVEVETKVADGQKWQQDYKIVDGKKIIIKPWFKI